MPTQTQVQQERLAELLDIKVLPPPGDFTARATVTDPGVYEQAAADAPAWWAGEARRRLDWQTPFQAVLDDSNAPFCTWFADGALNASYNCLDRHVNAGHGERVAFHWHGEQGEQRSLTYAEILADTQRLASALKAQGVGKGDIVGIYLPMIPEVVVAMLACARIGAPHNVVFGGFAPSAVRERMEVSQAKALITTDGARRRGRTAPVKQAVDEAIDGLDTLQTVIVVRSTGAPCRDAGRPGPLVSRPARGGRAGLPGRADGSRAPAVPAVLLRFHGQAEGHRAYHRRLPHRGDHDDRDGLRPRRRTGRVLVHRRRRLDHRALVRRLWPDGERRHLGDVRGRARLPGQGRLVAGGGEVPGVDLLHRPDRDPRLHEVGGAVSRPRHDLSSLRLLGTVGEPINPKAWLWYYAIIGGERCPVLDTWWQTETGAILIAPLPALTPAKPGSATRPLPGISATLFDEEGHEVTEGSGLLVLTQPWPSMLRTLYNDPDRYVETYFSRFGPKVYVAGDGARRDEAGYFWITGRIDDVINVSGHRLSTAEIESALVAHAAVAEAAVIAVPDETTGQAVVAYVTVVGDREPSQDLAEELRQHVGKRIGKFARPQRLIWAADLPKLGPGRSCAGCFAISPTAASSATSPR